MSSSSSRPFSAGHPLPPQLQMPWPNNGQLVLTLHTDNQPKSVVYMRVRGIPEVSSISFRIDEDQVAYQLDLMQADDRQRQAVWQVVRHARVRVMLSAPQSIEFLRADVMQKHGWTLEDWGAFAPGTERPTRDDQQDRK